MELLEPFEGYECPSVVGRLVRQCSELREAADRRCSLTVSHSLRSSSDDLKLVSGDNVAATIEHRLNQSRLVLECQQMCDHFDRCFSRLQALEGDIETLHRENSELRVANTELIKLVILSSLASISNRNLQCEKLLDLNERIWKRGPKNSLTKSASFGSSNYLKINLQQRAVNPPMSYSVRPLSLLARELECMNGK